MPIEELVRPDRIDEERIEKLKELFPEAFVDGKLKIEILKEEYEFLNEDIIEDKEEFFGLQWVGKTYSRKLSNLPVQGTLKLNEKYGVEDNNIAQNFLIEGDNLEVLRVLQKSYLGKIKLINIDPPYNTGKDFVYKDDFRESLDKYLQKSGQADEEGLLTSNPKTSGRYHANWLNMMYPRLRLAKSLLRKDGLIFVNIDEHEIHNLIHILNEIFGEENNLGTIVWDKKNPKGDSTTIAVQHEYIVCFAKNKEEFVNSGGISREKPNAIRMLKKAEELYSKLGKKGYPEDLMNIVKKYNLPKSILDENEIVYDLNTINKEFNDWIKKQDNLSGGESAYSKIDENGEVYQSVSMAWPNKKKAPEDYFVPLIHPITKKACPVPERGWRNPTTTMKRLLENGEILFGEDETTQPRRKYLLKNNLKENVPSVLPFGGSDDSYFSEIKIPFEHPKPYKFVKQLIKSVTKDNDIILDFFAGSGTTGHAVIEANIEDKNNRSFILVQIPEAINDKDFSTIAEITKERLKKSISKLKEQQLLNNYGFAVYTLSKSNLNKWANENVKNLSEINEQIDIFSTSIFNDDANDLDIITELMLHQGYPLNSEIETECISSNKIYKITHKDISSNLYVCVDIKIESETYDYLVNFVEKGTLICLDSALSNEQKVTISESINVKTI